MPLETELLATVAQAWGWAGLAPASIVAENEFANLLVKDDQGRFWHICPESLSCRIVAGDDGSFDELVADANFRIDWEMRNIVEVAQAMIGELEPDHRFCFAVPGVLGGAFTADNITHAPLLDIIRISGDIGRQIKDLPDGASVQLRFE